MTEKGVATGLTRSSGGSAVRLLVDESNPFYFDHSLDHVPGMLIVSELLDLVRAETGPLGPDRRVALKLVFRRFCEPDDEIFLSARPSSRAAEDAEDETGWTLTAEVEQRAACVGQAVLHRKSATQVLHAAPARPSTSLATARLLHRARAENVFLGAAWRDGEQLKAYAQRPAAGHVLESRPLEWVIETARQFGILVGHVGLGQPVGNKYILRRLEVDLPCDLLPGEMWLEWAPTPGSGHSVDMGIRIFHLRDEGGVEEIGEVAINTMIVNPGEYESIRFGTRPEKERIA